jgi:hypothetical protein
VAQAVVNSTAFTPQASTIFTFLGVSPSIIQRPSLIRELSLGGGISGANNLALGIELQPIWLVGCKNMTYDEYSKIPGFFRNLLNVYTGVGFIQNGQNISAGYSIKIPLFFKDPMSDKKYVDRMMFPFTDKERFFGREIQKIDLEIYRGRITPSQKAELLAKRSEMNSLLEADDATLRSSALIYKSNYQASNWNSAQANLIFAQGIDVNTAEPFSIKKVYMAGYLVANQPITFNGILSEMFKAHYEYITTTVTNTNIYFDYGLNFTFGNQSVNFYVEGIGRASLTNWFENITAGFGGHFVPNAKLSFDIGIRMTFDNKAHMINLYPAFNGSFRI